MEKNKDLVSIITPSYNSSAFIIETINSVRSQTYKNWEMIIVDDCSTDNTVEVIENYIKENNENRIRLYINQKNSSAAVSRNRAIREAKGKWIAFLDSDDLWKPNKLEEQISFMIEKKYHFSYTYYEEFYENVKKRKIVKAPYKVSNITLKMYCWIGCLTVIYDSEYVGLIQINPDIGNGRNDYALWLLVSEHANGYLLNKNLAMYRRREGSLSSKSYWRLIIQQYELFKLTYNCSVVKAWVFTFNNLFWGLIKKIFYVNKII